MSGTEQPRRLLSAGASRELVQDPLPDPASFVDRPTQLVDPSQLEQRLVCGQFGFRLLRRLLEQCDRPLGLIRGDENFGQQGDRGPGERAPHV